VAPGKQVDETITRIQAGNGDWTQHKLWVTELLKAHNNDINAIYDRLRKMEVRMATYAGCAVAAVWVIERFV